MLCETEPYNRILPQRLALVNLLIVLEVPLQHLLDPVDLVRTRQIVV
jgi:hypothetical protein